MKNAAVKTIKAEEIPVAANGNTWEPRNKSLDLRGVLREWQAEFDETPAAKDAAA